MNKHFGKRILISMLSLSLAGGTLAGTAYADDVPVAGIASHMQEEEPATAPIAAAETLAQVAIELSMMDQTSVDFIEELSTEAVLPEEAETEAVLPETEAEVPEETEEHPAILAMEEEVPEETEEHPAILAMEARMQANKHTAYDDIAVSQVESPVNIRTAPDAESDVVGKIYNNCAATIIETIETETGDWYKIQSGSVEGYIRAKYFVTGEDARTLAMEIGCVNATITTSSMRMRESADLGSATVTVLTSGQYYSVEEQGPEFSKLSIDGELTGYVQNDYLEFDIAFNEAVSIEEEQAREAEEERILREREEARERYLREQEEEEEDYYDDDEDYEEPTTVAPTTEEPETEERTTAAPTTEEPETEEPETEEPETEEPETEDPETEEPEEDETEEPEDETEEPEDETEEPEDETEEPEDKTEEPEDETEEPEDETEEPEDETEEPEDETEEPETTTEEPETTTEEPETTTEEPETTTEEPEEDETEEPEDDDDDDRISSVREAIVAEAWSHVGKLDYVWGGNSLKTGVDCSGFVQQIFKMYGVKLPRTSDEQGYCGEKVSKSEARPGDIVYYGGHIAIYVGDGMVVHASNSTYGVICSVWNYRSPISIRNVIGD